MYSKNILLTNDDGIDGEGLLELEKKLSEVCNVYVLAPSSNRSAVSSQLTMHYPLKIEKRGDNRFACFGSPVDCVITALRSDLFGVRFDAVFSGINKGANLGTDIIYSGTAAAARQAVLYKIPGIAVSLESFDDIWKYSALADFCAKNLEKLISLCTDELFVSLNACSSDKYKEAVISPLCIRDYRDMVSIIKAPDDKLYSFFKGGNIQSKGVDGCDAYISESGRIAISRIYAEPVCAAYDTEPLSFQF